MALKIVKAPRKGGTETVVRTVRNRMVAQLEVARLTKQHGSQFVFWTSPAGSK